MASFRRGKGKVRGRARGHRKTLNQLVGDRM